jgi:hypothetical protein
MNSIRERLDTVEDCQKITTEKVNKLDNTMYNFEYSHDIVVDDIDALDMKFEKHCEMCDQLADQVDKLEAEQRKNSIRIFGLIEQYDETDETLKSLIRKSVLDVACPDINIDDKDIMFAKRMGRQDNELSRMVLVKLADFNTKLNILKGRESLRKFGIRVANDWTIRQQNTLKSLKAKGQRGYFKGGRLHIIPSTNENDSTGIQNGVQTRVFKRVNRSMSQHYSDIENTHDVSTDTIVLSQSQTSSP